MSYDPWALRKQGTKGLLLTLIVDTRRKEMARDGERKKRKRTEKQASKEAMELKDTVEHVQKHKGTSKDHGPKKKSSIHKRGQGYISFRVNPGSPIHPWSGTRRDSLDHFNPGFLAS